MSSKKRSSGSGLDDSDISGGDSEQSFIVEGVLPQLFKLQEQIQRLTEERDSEAVQSQRLREQLHEAFAATEAKDELIESMKSDHEIDVGASAEREGELMAQLEAAAAEIKSLQVSIDGT